MENKDTLGNITTTPPLNENILFVIVIIAVVIMLYLLIRTKAPKPVEGNEIKPVPATKEKDSFVDSEFGVNKTEYNSTKTFVSKPNMSTIAKPVEEIVKPPVKETITKVVVIEKEEEQTKEKHIGYNPINLFKQTEPLYYPYVMMPKPNCIIKFPRKGRAGRKGFKEEAFKEHIDKYFKNNYQVYDDRFVLVANNSKPYEPDFTLINEKNGINIFVDIEIDEPYEGTNDIENRKPTHYKYSDTNRNYAFTNRGWIVIRFAEIQIHQQPDGCCKFIAHILKSIHSEYIIPQNLEQFENVNPVLQWTKEQARQWFLEKYRERYLGIDRFGITANNNVMFDIEETELGKAIEEQVKDEVIQVDNKAEVNLTKLSKLMMASVTEKYASFDINGEKRLIKPTYVYDNETSGFCYVKNIVGIFAISDMDNIVIKDNYYTTKLSGPIIGIDKIANIVNTAIEYDKYIRMKYTRIAWQNMAVDTETGELFIDNVEAEESIRTVSNVQLAINALTNEHIENYRLNSNYLTAYCHKREEKRTFKFDRIGEIEILDL